MSFFTIKAIQAGTLTMPKPSLAGGDVDEDLLIEFPFTCFLLRNGEENILVDTGMKESYLEQMAIGECHPTGSTQFLLEGLKGRGTDNRLLIIPLIIYLICSLLPVSKTVFGISVLLASMPAGATTSMLAAKYDKDPIFAAQLVVFYTICSIPALMIWMLIVS